MPRRGYRKPKKPFGNPNDPDGFFVWVRRYLEALRVRNYSERTVEQRTLYLELFARWSAERGVEQPRQVTHAIAERYQRHLFHKRQKNGRPLSFQSQHGQLIALRGFFRYLMRQHAIANNPTSELELPRIGHRLPRTVLTLSEAERVLLLADTGDVLGLRDRAMLETFLSTGMRRSELGGLSVYDVDAERGTVLIREGKGRKDRVVPLGERAAVWIDRYLEGARPKLVVPPDQGVLFLTQAGERFTANALTHLVRDYVAAAELGKRGACHMFRHTMATLMLEGGADVRFIQAMLGHEGLEATHIYTRVSVRALRQVHAATHPTARLEAREPAEPPTAKDVGALHVRVRDDDGEDDDDDEAPSR